jgi:hypothetical protein
MRHDMVPLPGNTYPIRRQLRSLGGEFDSAGRVWMLPANRIAEAKKFLSAGRGEAGKSGVEKSGPGRRNEELDGQQLDDLLRAQFSLLRSEVIFAGRWDDDAECRIEELAARLKAKGRDVVWVDRTIEDFRRKLGEQKKRAC